MLTYRRVCVCVFVYYYLLVCWCYWPTALYLHVSKPACPKWSLRSLQLQLSYYLRLVCVVTQRCRARERGLKWGYKTSLSLSLFPSSATYLSLFPLVFLVPSPQWKPFVCIILKITPPRNLCLFQGIKSRYFSEDTLSSVSRLMKLTVSILLNYRNTAEALK